jgi:hypothetical protein
MFVTLKPVTLTGAALGTALLLLAACGEPTEQPAEQKQGSVQQPATLASAAEPQASQQQ